ncbi:C40 family peptidase [Candidatus Accumulibacter sp. ACC003]|uniref:C40 family peptidase n=1 Tax=Candidatus Accumulibacter sp. ACC003 TaxID=2823334 RepID=UPI0025BA12E2|nr:C40 family peptidase [Candidatus Accumulibacter sp. ACC003]
MRVLQFLIAAALSLLVAACGSTSERRSELRERPVLSEKSSNVVIFALGLIDTGYRFGGKNPEAGFDCSGMVAYIYGHAAGVKVGGSAADIARAGRPVPRDDLHPGDLLFFNTRSSSFSHVGIYIGDGRFVHAPSTRGKVRIDYLATEYYAQRFETARSYFE